MTLITEQTQLVEACRRLANETFLSIDTEFMREKTYYPQLCLIQIAGKKEAIVIDAYVAYDSLFFIDEIGNIRVSM